MTREGRRLCSIDFDTIGGHFSEGLTRVYKRGFGYGFANREMKFLIPMKYPDAEDFHDGKAKVQHDGKWMYIDKAGNETEIGTEESSKYQEVGEYSEGMCKVSTLKLRFMDLAYHSDYEEIAGIWGFVNEAGEEVISPQYIYAQDFKDGIALACKGKWTIDPKWDNKYNTGRYWTEEELWGAIDKDGNTVIPFQFDEVKHLDFPDGQEETAFVVHYGGWENGHWGVIDNRGNWLADPVFEDIGYGYDDGVITFYDRDSWDDDALMGLYDLKEKKVIIEPQFYDIDFLSDGWLQVEVNDEELGRHVERLIDRSGKEKFHSIYTFLHAWQKPPYEVVIREEDGDKIGLIDENGNVLVPCQSDIAWDGILYDQKRIIFKDGEKKGVRDFDGNIIIPPLFSEIHFSDRPLVKVRLGDRNNYTEGIFTKEGIQVVPAEYKYISFYEDGYFACCRDGHCEMLRYVERRSV